MKDTVQALIDAHLPSIEGPADVAALMAMSYHTLRRQFKREAGVSLARFIAQRRVARAQELLRETDLRHYEICYLVGFPSEVTGARTFKRITGQTMTDYRGVHGNSEGARGAQN
jgi:AraC-like DNA-binding protein